LLKTENFNLKARDRVAPMNFFEHQDRARRQTRRLVMAFMLAVIAIVVAINALVLFGTGMLAQGGAPLQEPFEWMRVWPVAATTTVITVLVILIGSAWRTVQLRGGGARVATELGGVPVDGSSTDPLRRRLLNVVEEMAIASGVPVPQVFVLEQESGINAFAAGWSTADAAVAVTRGALERLNREELQGVIAHEFSHVFNGDMRLNIRLMGVLFGILVIALVGRRMLSSMRFVGRGRNRNGGMIVLVALGIMVIGYIGLFFGRWIQAAVSRQREYLADASAIQFTRYPAGITGALKKIGALSAGSVLQTNSDEVGHMLFASGLAGRLFATHPPLDDRIRKIDPSFDPSELRDIAQRMRQEANAAAAVAAARAESGAVESKRQAPIHLDAASLIERIGEPGLAQILTVAALLESIPAPLSRAAHSDAWAAELLLRLLLSSDAEVRERQLLRIASRRESDSEARVRQLFEIDPNLDHGLRLPLLELAFPALRRRPESELIPLMRLVEELVEADGEVELFEFVLARLLALEISRLLQPSRRKPGGSAGLADLTDETADLLWILARHGHRDDAAAAVGAYEAARAVLPGLPSRSPATDLVWSKRLDTIFSALERLSMNARAELIAAMLECARHDAVIEIAEYELLRLVAGVLEVPLPLLIDPDS
jgi:Zn-dependent protease with chaperone function